MIYLLTYLIVGLPVALIIALVANKKEPLIRRIGSALLYWSVWPILPASMALDLLKVRRIQMICAWCGEKVGTGRPKDYNDRELWRKHAHTCPKHPLREELDRAEEIRANYDNACKLVAAMHEAAVGKVRGPIRGVVEDVKYLRDSLELVDQAACYPADIFPETRGDEAAFREEIHKVAFNALEGVK